MARSHSLLFRTYGTLIGFGLLQVSRVRPTSPEGLYYVTDATVTRRGMKLIDFSFEALVLLLPRTVELRLPEVLALNNPSLFSFGFGSVGGIVVLGHLRGLHLGPLLVPRTLNH